jgi:TRAP-type C4-dicarboxylate transport system permease large subunit
VTDVQAAGVTAVWATIVAEIMTRAFGMSRRVAFVAAALTATFWIAFIFINY